VKARLTILGLASALACSGTAVMIDGGVDATTTDAAALVDAPVDVHTTTDAGDAGDAATASDAPSDTPDVDASCPTLPVIDAEQVTIGTPSWHVSEVLLFKAPLGDPNDASPAVASCLAVVSPNHNYDWAKGFFKSSVAHPPPYDSEFSTNIVDSGFANAGCFQLSDLTSPSGFMVIINLVPSKTASIGISFEQPDGGPIIQFSTLNFSGELDIDGVLVDPYFSGTCPKAAFLYDYSGNWAGFGHLLFSFGDNDKFSPNPLTKGAYTFKYTLDDGANATQQSVHFGVQ
jgi:hypothetical protein